MQTSETPNAIGGTQVGIMRAIRIHAYGGPEVMQLEEVPMPIPRPGQARVRVHAASVNFLDVQKRRG
jgi:NADPH:quinone reductase